MHVLLIEDTPSDAKLFEWYLRKYAPCSTYTHVVCLADSLPVVKDLAQRVDVIVLDLNLPDARGLQGLEQLIYAAPRVPIVILTGSDELEAASMHKGARAYILKKNLDGPTFAAAVRDIVEDFQAHG